MSYFATYYLLLKKFAAISLLLLLSFNWYGYRLVTAFFEQKADQKLEASIDNNQYDESQLIELRMPLNVPYQNNQSEFERHYGEVEIDGQIYTYVKRKIENGELVLKCIPNHSKQKIKAVGNDFYKMTNGLDQNQPEKKQDNNSSVAKVFGAEFDDQLDLLTINPPVVLVTRSYVGNPFALYHITQPTPEQPPDILRPVVG